MNYHNITKDDMLNGEGIRTVLWVAGCNHYCPGCQNPVTWNPYDGKPFTQDDETELFTYLDADYCDGLTLSGGDPMYPMNRSSIHRLLRRFRHRYADRKTVWMYTGYLLEEIKHEPLLEYVDVIVDGPYVQELRNTNRQWCGSENQVIWRKCKHGVWYPEESKYAVEKEGQGCRAES